MPDTSQGTPTEFAVGKGRKDRPCLAGLSVTLSSGQAKGGAIPLRDGHPRVKSLDGSKLGKQSQGQRLKLLCINLATTVWFGSGLVRSTTAILVRDLFPSWREAVERSPQPGTGRSWGEW